MDLAEVIDRLASRDALPLFAEQPWDEEIARTLREVDPAGLLDGRPLRDASLAACALAGLHLWNDDFHGAHDLCQGIATETGSYWHALCHRREGRAGSGLESNLGNAGYWFRRTGRHPAFTDVRTSALETLQAARASAWAKAALARIQSEPDWEPFLTLDWFREAGAGRLSPTDEKTLRRLQTREIAGLVAWCRDRA